MKKEEIKESSDNDNEKAEYDDTLEENNDVSSKVENDQEKLLEENIKLNDLLLRSKAELENFQKRTLKQMQQAQLYSTERLSSELLVIMDSLEAANKLSDDSNLKIDTLIEGNSLLLKTTKEIFDKLEIEEIDPLHGDFDPEYHQAMATKESEITENKVLEVMQKGYKLKSKLLRPALVIVSKKNK